MKLTIEIADRVVKAIQAKSESIRHMGDPIDPEDPIIQNYRDAAAWVMMAVEDALLDLKEGK